MTALAKQLRQFQANDAVWLAGQRRAFLLLEQGLGKTPVAIRAANLVGARRVVVVCEAIGRENWRREFHAWSRDRRLRFFVVSYNYVSSGKPMPDHCDILMIDEAQKLKSPTSNRTRALYGPKANGAGYITRADRVWNLSGTLCPNGPHEMYTHLRALYPERLPRVKAGIMANWQWETRLFHTRATKHGNNVFGPKRGTISLIQKAMHGTFRRRLKKDVLPELPPIQFNDRWVQQQDVVDELNRNPAVVELESAIADSLLIYGDLSGVDDESEHIATARKLIGIAKAPLIAELARDYLESGCRKLIVFAYHRDVLQIIMDKCRDYSPVMVRGGMTERQRQRSVDSFQDLNSKCRLFAGQIQAAGTTITLTAAQQELFAESSWVPSDDAQAAARAHRIGQGGHVQATFAALSDSIDVRVMRTARRKAETLRQFWDQ